jgi:hypothetical protein
MDDGGRAGRKLGARASREKGKAKSDKALLMATIASDSGLSSKVRWTIVGLLSTSIAINLLDRQVLSVLASELRTQFQWTNAQYGYIAVSR